MLFPVEYTNRDTNCNLHSRTFRTSATSIKRILSLFSDNVRINVKYIYPAISILTKILQMFFSRNLY